VPAGIAVSATVPGEFHCIGARMVSDLLEAAGWKSLYLGANAQGMDTLRMLCDHKVDVLALSCSYVPNLREVAALIAAVRAMPECSGTRVMVGGRPFDDCPDLWKDVGADDWAPDASRAVEVANRLRAG
jgi:methanogenic corrinoid protein MtbC1